jgi:acyl-CoA synthetase (AMP-forming)/AMP-acid ligase II
VTGNEAGDLLAAARRRRPSGPAVHCGDRAPGYADLDALAAGMERSLAAAGARPGDRVAVLAANCHRYLACYHAALRGGLVLMPLNTRLAPPEQHAVLDHGGARLILGDTDKLAGLAPAIPGGPVETPAGLDGWGLVALEGDGGGEAPPPDTAHLYYTSGTTGKPKGVILTRANLMAHVGMTIDELGFGEKDVWLHAAPMFHLADAWAVWTVTATAGTHVMLPRFDAAAAYDTIARHGVTITNLVPTMMQALVEEAERRRRPLPSFRLLLSGGAPIAPATVARIGRAIGCEYVQTYGLTETSPFLTFSILDDAIRALPADEQLRYRARTGRPARGVALRVVDTAGESLRDVPADDRSVGEVVVRGATVTPGYWRDAAATAAAFRDGWFRTGDLGTLDGRGFLNLVDRAKDVIVTGGETVYSTEVEHALHDHPAVREAAVFAVPDERWGEAVRAAVALRDGALVDPTALIAFCRGRIAGYKCPRQIDILPALPRTGSGKIDKKTMREPFWIGRTRRIN